MQESTAGVGLLFKRTSPSSPCIVSTIFDASPAYAAGVIGVGDTLLSVNGADLSKSSPAEVRDAIFGPAGTNVTLTFRPSKSGAPSSAADVPYTITLRRAAAKPTTPRSTRGADSMTSLNSRRDATSVQKPAPASQRSASSKPFEEVARFMTTSRLLF